MIKEGAPKEIVQEPANKPETKKPRRSFGLKHASVALILATASAGKAEQPKETKVTEVETAKTFQSLVDRNFEQHQKFITELLSEPSFANSEHTKSMAKGLEETRPFLHDERYLVGLQKLQELGCDLRNFVGVFDPKILMSDHLDELIDRVPKELAPHVILTAKEFQEKPEFAFDRPGLLDCAKKFSGSGIKLSLYTLNQALGLEQKYPDIVDLTISIDKQNAGKIGAFEFLDAAEKINFDFAVFTNPEFAKGVAELTKNGVPFYELTSEFKPENKARLEERMTDPNFIKTLVSLKQIDVGYFGALSKVKPDVYNHPLFLKNIQTIVKYTESTNLSFDQSTLLTIEGLDEYLQGVPKNCLDKALRFVEEVGVSPNAWSQVGVYTKRYAGNSSAISALLELNIIRLTDATYRMLFERYADKKKQEGTKDEKKDQVMEGVREFLAMEQEFLIEKTGKSLNEHLNGSLADFFSILDNPETNPIVIEELDKHRSRMLVMPVLRMNEGHDGTFGKRLAELKGLSSRVLFEAMSTAGGDAYLSTFRLIYNANGYTGPEASYSFMHKVKAEYGSLHSFLKANNVSKKQFGYFMGLISQNNILENFLADMGGEAEQKEVLTEFLFDPSEGLSKDQALVLDDLLQTSSSNTVRDFVLESLQKVMDGGANKSSSQIAELLVTQFYFKESNVPDWAKQAVENNRKYFPDISIFEEEHAFRLEGDVETNIQLHFFYDDRAADKAESTWDGHHSFKNFINSLGGNVSWDKAGVIQKVAVRKDLKLEDHDGYITITKRDSRTNRQIVIHANKPDQSNETVEKIQGDLMTKQKPQIVVHRGHSYHAQSTINLVNEDVKLVNLGSCGGAKLISKVLAKSHGAQVISTRSVGTMLVNDAVLSTINEELLRSGNINWTNMRTGLDKEFARRGGFSTDRWSSYVLPNQNRIAHLVGAIDMVLSEKQ